MSPRESFKMFQFQGWIFILLGCTNLLVAASQQDGTRVAPSIWLNQRDLPRRPSEKLNVILNRVGPNMRSSTNYHDFQDIALNESIEAWQLLHEQARSIAQDQVDLFKPHIMSIMQQANVTQDCHKSMGQTLDRMKNLESWALEMWSATSNFPPVGLIDGHVSDIGSYKACVDISIPRDSNLSFAHSSFCLAPFRPVTPTRPRFHSIFKQLPPELINLFNRSDFFHTFAKKAQYFYYLYRKTGICVPASCTPGDVQNVVNLVSNRLALTSGPVKCFTRATEFNTNNSNWMQPFLRHELEEIHFGSIENEPILVQIGKKPNRIQTISLVIVGSFFVLVLVSSFWHAVELVMDKTRAANKHDQQTVLVDRFWGLKYVAFYYFSTITNGEEFFKTSLRSNDIRCLHGLRVITMLWIICVHTLQYNDWSGFTRVYNTEESMRSVFLHPIVNANYVVDNFFLISGLLAAYTTWNSNKGTSANFSILTSLMSRYLRLTPQVLLISLLYILLPLIGDGPFWYDMTHDASKNCEKNWWINALHLQAFYRDNEMCNLVGWWISVDMFYYIIAVFLLWLILNGRTGRAMFVSLLFVSYSVGKTIYIHYSGGFAPNNLGSVPQVGEVWSEYVIRFNWSPYPHAYIFFLGLWIGYCLANNKWKYQVERWSNVGWIVSVLILVCVNLSSHVWVSGAAEPTNQEISTSYNVLTAILWANAFGWIIVSLHYGSLPSFSALLSSNFFILLSKASFIIYLSHMLVIRIVFGTQYHTLEVSPGVLLYLITGNIFLSVILGIFLCITFEGPCLKFQRRIVEQVRPRKHLPLAGASYFNNVEKTPNLSPNMISVIFNKSPNTGGDQSESSSDRTVFV